MLKAHKLVKQIEKLQEELHQHQKRCKHIKKTSEHGASTGNYDPSDDTYWVTYTCPTCLKRWTEYN